MKRYFKRRGFTDRLYMLNFISVHIINLSIILITIFQNALSISDLSAVASIPQFAYAELAIHTGFIVWKAKCENMQKYKREDGIMME